MVHICLVGNTAWSMYNFRGSLISSLISSNYKITIIAPFDPVYTKKIEYLGAKFINIYLDSKSINPLKDLIFAKNLYSIYSKLKPDFIFHYTIKPNIYGSIVAKLKKIPQIPIVTGLGYTFISKNIISKISIILYKISFKSAKQVWFLNEDDKDIFIERNLISSSNAHILRGEGIDLSLFKIESLEKTNPITFLLSARMIWEKGIGEFIEAARIIKEKYPETKFQLLGFLGVNNPSAISREQIDKWQDEGIIEYLGSTENVIPYINVATCIVLPSYYREGIPFSLLEACASGKPIITTNSVGCKEVVDDEVTGYLCGIKDPESLANCMDKIINLSPEKYAQMGKAGRLKMEQEFDVNLIIHKYKETLQKNL